jgi:SAM-dependent methyltransferase
MSDKDVGEFNARAARYETDWLGRNFHGPVQRTTLDIAAGLAPNPTAILDVGCGTGALLRMAAQRFPAATRTGIDPAERMIEVATEADSTARLHVAPAERLPFDDGAFDLVLSTNSFHNWSDQAVGIAEIGRVLADGGTLVLVDPFALGALRAWAALVGKRRRMRTRRDVEAMLAVAGLRSIGWQAVAPMVHAVTASSR